MSVHEQGFELNDLDGLDGLDLEEFDPSQHLTSSDAISAYMTDILASGDVALFQSAVNDVVRAEGMAKVAEAAGLTREGAYKALRAGSKPRFVTIVAMLDALGLALAVVPKESKEALSGSEDSHVLVA